MNNSNLQPWIKGTSGNPQGRPKGSRNLRNIIADLLTSEMTYTLPNSLLYEGSTPIKAIVGALAIKAIRGDTRAADILLKYAINDEVETDMTRQYRHILIYPLGAEAMSEAMPDRD